MFPELLSQSIIKLLIDTFDPEKKGTAIEVGVGTGNFYSVMYKKAGLNCIAVDPIAYEPFLKIAEENQIYFEAACIYDTEGEITLFSSKHSDFSSINEDWFGIDIYNQQKVRSILLKSLLNKYNVNAITFLKIDVEGSEFEIIKQLVELEESKLPLVLEFEYGGGGLKKDGNGGWSKKFFDKVLGILHILKDLNYQQGLILDSKDTLPVFVNLQSFEDTDKLFKPHYEYGNFLAFKKPITNIAAFESVLLKSQTIELEKMILNLQAENSVLGTKLIKIQYFKRLVNKVKKTLKRLG